MLKNVILVILLNLCLLTFGQKEQTDLGDFFSKSEIKELNLIADFFQTELCGSSDRTKFGECIKSLVPEIIDLEKNYIEKNISYRNQKKLYNRISKSTFEKIWSLCKTWKTEEPKYEYQSLCFSGNQTFIKFVLELGKTSGYLSRYGQMLEAVGGLGNGNFLASNIIQFPKSINIEDRGVQIVFAIHYLTQNDNRKRDKMAIRLEKRDLKELNRKLKRKNK